MNALDYEAISLIIAGTHLENQKFKQLEEPVNLWKYLRNGNNWMIKIEVLQQMILLEQICPIHCQIKCNEIHQNQEDHYQNQDFGNLVLPDLKGLQQLVLKHNNQTHYCHYAGGHARISC